MKYIYLFPDEPAMGHYQYECRRFGCEYLGKNRFQGERNLVIKGQLSDLKRYANSIGYDLHPDYLYKEDDFAGDISDACKDKKVNGEEWFCTVFNKEGTEAMDFKSYKEAKAYGDRKYGPGNYVIESPFDDSCKDACKDEMYINGSLKDFNPRELVENVKRRQESLHTNRLDKSGKVHTIFVNAHGLIETPSLIYVDIITQDVKGDNQERVLMKRCKDWEEAIQVMENYKRQHMNDSCKDAKIYYVLNVNNRLLANDDTLLPEWSEFVQCFPTPEKAEQYAKNLGLVNYKVSKYDYYNRKIIDETPYQKQYNGLEKELKKMDSIHKAIKAYKKFKKDSKLNDSAASSSIEEIKSKYSGLKFYDIKYADRGSYVLFRFSISGNLPENLDRFDHTWKAPFERFVKYVLEKHGFDDVSVDTSNRNGQLFVYVVATGEKDELKDSKLNDDEITSNLPKQPGQERYFQLIKPFGEYNFVKVECERQWDERKAEKEPVLFTMVGYTTSTQKNKFEKYGHSSNWTSSGWGFGRFKLYDIVKFLKEHNAKVSSKSAMDSVKDAVSLRKGDWFIKNNLIRRNFADIHLYKVIDDKLQERNGFAPSLVAEEYYLDTIDLRYGGYDKLQKRGTTTLSPRDIENITVFNSAEEAFKWLKTRVAAIKSVSEK